MFIKKMASIGVMASELHKRNDSHSYLNDFNCDLPNLDQFYSEMVHLPCGWWLSKEDRLRIVNCIKEGW
jgi:dTDP-4-amino-4,6-dideoxygalactose transaminase